MAHWLFIEFFSCVSFKVIPGAIGVNCDSVDLVNPAFGEAYDASSRATDQMDQQFDVNIQAYKYNKKYLTDFRYDNCYVTTYFRQIDARRLMQKKKTLLPLKKTEETECISPYSLKMMKVERRKLGRGTFILLARAFLAAMIFSTDYLLYSALDIIRRYSKVDYKQTGINHIDIQVGGKGFMSDVVRLFLEAFNTKHDLKQVTTNYECLPRPKKLDDVYYMYVFGIYGIMWLLAFLEAYGLRFRRLIASFFYRKRESRRMLNQFNNMLFNNLLQREKSPGKETCVIPLQQHAEKTERIPAFYEEENKARKLDLCMLCDNSFRACANVSVSSLLPKLNVSSAMILKVRDFICARGMAANSDIVRSAGRMSRENVMLAYHRKSSAPPTAASIVTQRHQRVTEMFT
ncbi:hypothetical protein CHS0354_032066 [Potamilus streckersoni]|uniref:Dendritic cell-specific transmembrane protein-like domain-containing protein n=1 Tax=Potamilus streckersoni TaxID=2493646 RepID=A0AAE0TMQ6_9BIVA|nr:hypothetical protein CHS0354_032066 [Potamilus streckersoni]